MWVCIHEEEELLSPSQNGRLKKWFHYWTSEAHSTPFPAHYLINDVTHESGIRHTGQFQVYRDIVRNVRERSYSLQKVWWGGKNAMKMKVIKRPRCTLAFIAFVARFLHDLTDERQELPHTKRTCCRAEEKLDHTSCPHRRQDYLFLTHTNKILEGARVEVNKMLCTLPLEVSSDAFPHSVPPSYAGPRAPPGLAGTPQDWTQIFLACPLPHWKGHGRRWTGWHLGLSAAPTLHLREPIELRWDLWDWHTTIIASVDEQRTCIPWS